MGAVGSARGLRVCHAWSPTTDSIDDETTELLEKYAEKFKAGDINGDGLLQRDELRSLLEKVGDGSESVPMHWLTDADLDEIFEQYDRDRNGAISLDEFMQLAQDNVFLTKELSAYKAAFNAVDVGGDGFIGPNEMCAVLTVLGSSLRSYEEITRLMGKYDKDHSGRIDFPEFLRLCRYEKALPLDDILRYAATLSASRSGDGSASSSSSDDATEAHSKELVMSIASESAFRNILSFNKENGKLVVVMGTLSWCRPCKRFNSAYERLAAAYPNVVFLRLNGNDSEDTKQLFKKKLKIRATPSFLFFRNAELVGSTTGANTSRFETVMRAMLKDGEIPEKSVYELMDVKEALAHAG